MAANLYVPLYPEEKDASPATVCVTGASGFVAGPIVQRLLAAGHTVHATVRDPSNEKSVAQLKALPGASEHLKLFKADLLTPGAFTEAVQGCKYVLHTASPFFTPDDKEDVKQTLLEPAVKGTTNILEAVNACSSVERVVLTSSVAAIYNSNKDGSQQQDESDWAEQTSETNNPYAYSKFLAEKKAWEMAKAQDRWKLVCINPVYVMGPPIGDRMDGESIKIISDMFNGNYLETPDRTFTIVDVRDVAAAHCLAMVHPEAHGRNLVCEGTYNVTQLCQFLHEKWPCVKVPDGEVKMNKLMLNNSKIQKDMGFSFHSTKQCVEDMVTKLIDIGKLQISGNGQ